MLTRVFNVNVKISQTLPAGTMKDKQNDFGLENQSKVSQI